MNARRSTLAGRRRADNLVLRWGKRLAGAYLLLLSVAIIATYSQAQRTGELASRLHGAAVGSCERLNIQRAETNQSDFAAWKFFRLVVHLTATSRTRSKPQAVAFSRQLRAYAAGVRWTPQTDCAQAVEHPVRYRAPLPRTFFLDPDGSTPRVIARALKTP